MRVLTSCFYLVKCHQNPVDINLANNADLWDDTLLIKRYENSLRLAQEQVAKRIAQSTNNQSAAESQTQSDADTDAPHKVGDFVRCTYSEDGVDYEARIVSQHDDDQFTIKYLGYDNEETVDADALIASWGEKTRAEQIAVATAQHETLSTDETNKPPTRNAKKGAGKSKARNANVFERYQTSLMIPPPPPLPPHLGEMSEDSEHLSAMLMSWYMSGYYTGLYQGRKSANSGK